MDRTSAGVASGYNGAVTVAYNALAARAGLEALKQGGNAIDALLTAAHIYKKHLDVFTSFGELPEEEEVSEEEALPADLVSKLTMPVSELELSVRSANCLREAKIKTISDLVQRSEPEMLKFRNFGKKSLTEISAILKEMNVGFGMKLDKQTLSQVAQGE